MSNHQRTTNTPPPLPPDDIQQQMLQDYALELSKITQKFVDKRCRHINDVIGLSALLLNSAEMMLVSASNRETAATCFYYKADQLVAPEDVK